MDSIICDTHKYIYLADDDSDDRKLFAEILEQTDNSISLIQAQNGKQLLDLLYTPTNPPPHLVIIDINMPLINGFECLEEIRSKKEIFPPLKVIMLSTCNAPASMEEAFKLGATCYVTKPNTLNGWKAFISDLLKID